MHPPNGDPQSGWTPGATASSWYSRYEYTSSTAVYDGLPSRHVWRGLTIVWGLKYISSPMTLVDPGWQTTTNENPTVPCISFNGKIDFSAWYPAVWDPATLHAGNWSSSTYAFYTQCGRTPINGQPGIGGNGAGGPRLLGEPVKYGGQEVVKAVLMCRMGKPSLPTMGCHGKQQMNVAFDDGRVVTLGDIPKHLQEMVNAGRDLGNESYRIDSDTSTWWRWATVQAEK